VLVETMAEGQVSNATITPDAADELAQALKHYAMEARKKSTK
jgi:hypothetical protein